VGPRAGLHRCGKSRPTGIRSPDRPDRRQSLYRLSYLAHIMSLIQYTVLTVVTSESDHFSVAFRCLSLNSHVRLFDHKFRRSQFFLYAYGT
jgi:hypothetical protein